MNTRTYPRTLQQAFKGVDYACAVERPTRRHSRVLWAVIALGLVVALVAARS